MGYFSWDCSHCNKSLRAALSDGEFKLSHGIALLRDGTILKGVYDGYGKLDGRELGDEPEVYHAHCWEEAGRPVDFTKPSESAADQGFFVDEIEDDEPDECAECGCELDPDWDDGDLCEDCEAANEEICPDCMDEVIDGECACDEML